MLPTMSPNTFGVMVTISLNLATYQISNNYIVDFYFQMATILQDTFGDLFSVKVTIKVRHSKPQNI